MVGGISRSVMGPRDAEGAKCALGLADVGHRDQQAGNRGRAKRRAVGERLHPLRLEAARHLLEVQRLDEDEREIREGIRCVGESGQSGAAPRRPHPPLDPLLERHHGVRAETLKDRKATVVAVASVRRAVDGGHLDTTARQRQGLAQDAGLHQRQLCTAEDELTGATTPAAPGAQFEDDLALAVPRRSGVALSIRGAIGARGRSGRG